MVVLTKRLKVNRNVQREVQQEWLSSNLDGAKEPRNGHLKENQ